MTFKTSTGLRNKVMDTGSVKTVMNLGFIKMYSGPVPDSADDALDPSNTLLTTISNDGTATGLTMDVATDGVLPKAAAEVWKGTNVAGGVATFYRHVAVGDDGTLSTTQARVQGSIGLAGAEMNLSNTTLALGAVQTVDYYVIALPTM